MAPARSARSPSALKQRLARPCLASPTPIGPGLCILLTGQISSRSPDFHEVSREMDKKLRDVQVGDKDERDKGAIKGQREEHRVQGSSSSLGAGGWQCWPRLDPTCTWPQMSSLPVRKHIGPRAHGPTRLLSFRELTIPLYRDGPPFPTLRDPAWAQKSWSTRPKTPRVPP